MVKHISEFITFANPLLSASKHGKLCTLNVAILVLFPNNIKQPLMDGTVYDDKCGWSDENIFIL